MLSMSHASSLSKATCKKQFKLQTRQFSMWEAGQETPNMSNINKLPNQGHGEDQLSFRNFNIFCLFLINFVLRKFHTGTKCLLASLTPHPFPFPYHPRTPHSSPQISRAFMSTSFVLWYIVTNKGHLCVHGFEATHWSLVGSAVATPLETLFPGLLASIGRQNFSCKG